MTLIDSPSGKRDYHIPKAIAYADYAVLAVAADNAAAGVWGDTFVHATIAYGLGIRSLIVAITKMDLVDYRNDTYDQIQSAVNQRLLDIGFRGSNLIYLPFSSAFFRPHEFRESPLKWYAGKSLQETLENMKVPLRQMDAPLRMMVFGVYGISGVGTVFFGKIMSGSLNKGDIIFDISNGPKGEPRSIEHAYLEVSYASAGDIIGINVKGIAVSSFRNSPQYIISLINTDTIRPVSELKAIINVVNCSFNLHVGASCRLDGYGQSIGCRIVQIILSMIYDDIFDQFNIKLNLKKCMIFNTKAAGIPKSKNFYYLGVEFHQDGSLWNKSKLMREFREKTIKLSKLAWYNPIKSHIIWTIMVGSKPNVIT